jgi:uncharacterized protein
VNYQGKPGLHPLSYKEHRPFPTPKGPWIGHMNWHELLFAHWPMDPDIMRPLIPPGLTLETWDGQAWIGVVPFRMSGVRPRFSPSIPGLSAFPELNVRTYVTAEAKPGVWFFSLDAAKALAVWGARTFFYLPYFNAQMEAMKQSDDTIVYRSHRTHKGAPPADFRATYRPTGNVYYSERDTLEHFLTERYCLYSANKGMVYRSGIHHLPWPLQPAEWSVEINTMTQAAGVDLPEMQPLLHYADFIKVVFWPLEPVR